MHEIKVEKSIMEWAPHDLIASYCNQGPRQLQTEMRGVFHYDHLLAYTAAFMRPSDMVCSPTQTRLTALWLTSYLAHWGMFRGSSQLKKTNVLFFDYLAASLLDPESGALLPFFGVQLPDLMHLEKGVISRVLTSVRALIQRHGVTPTDTLVSKLILGCTGTVPGYDRYVKKGLKRLAETGRYEGPCHFDEVGLRALSQWYRLQTWPHLKCTVDKRFGLPSARLADMALSVFGELSD